MAMPEEMPRIKDLAARLDVDVDRARAQLPHLQASRTCSPRTSPTCWTSSCATPSASRATSRAGPAGARRVDGGERPTGVEPEQDEVVVVPDNNSNSLLIAAGKSRYQEVLELIRQLDRRQDQVLIETALIELTGTDFTRASGSSWSFADTITDSDGNAIPGATQASGVSQLQDLSQVQRRRSPTPACSSACPTSPNGITAGIHRLPTSINLPFLIAAVQRTTRRGGQCPQRARRSSSTTTASATGRDPGRAADDDRSRPPAAARPARRPRRTSASFEEAGITLVHLAVDQRRRATCGSTSHSSRLDLRGQPSPENSAIPPPRTTRLSWPPR